MDTTSVSPLRSFSTLFGVAWKNFNQHFQTLLGITLIGLLPQLVLNMPAKEDAPVNPGLFVVGLIAIFLALWMSAAIYFFVVKKPAEKNPLKIYSLVLQYVWRFFTTGLLQGLIYLAIGFVIAIPAFLILGFSAASLFGGNTANALLDNALTLIFGGILVFLVAMVPLLWLSIRWQFSSLFVITDGIANFTAMRQSAQLVKGRWWSVFGRMFLFGILMLGYFTVIGIITSFFGENMVAAGLQTFLTGLVTGPLFICFEVELFSDLRQSTKSSQTISTPQPMVTT